MYCPKCGNKIKEGSKFCGKCGATLQEVPAHEAATPAEVRTPQHDNSAEAAPQTEEPYPQNSKEGPEKGNRRWKIALVIVICAAVVAVGFFSWQEVRERQFRNHMDLGRDYMEKESYDEAVVEFEAAIEIDSKVVEPYIELSDAYQELGETDKVEGTIDEARTMIVDTYKRKGELPEESETLYYIAVDDAIENDDIERAEEIRGEYIDMGGEGDELPAIPEAEPGPEPEPEPAEETTVQLSKESIKEMLELFSYWEAYQLYDWYTTDELYHNEETIAEFSSYEDIGMSQACSIAGRILYDHGYYERAQGVSSAAGGSYGELSISQLDEYLSDLFGMTYNAEDFANHADEVGTDEVMQGEEGQMYASIGDYGAIGVDVSVEYIADTPDEDGTYKVLARYDESYDDDLPESIYYVQYRVRPDENSKYGCVIVGMVPAGYGEIDPEFLPESNTGD